MWNENKVQRYFDIYSPQTNSEIIVDMDKIKPKYQILFHYSKPIIIYYAIVDGIDGYNEHIKTLPYKCIYDKNTGLYHKQK